MAKIKRIIIGLGEKEIALTEAEARELKAELDNLFGAPVAHPVPVIPYLPPYSSPVTWEPKTAPRIIEVTYC